MPRMILAIDFDGTIVEHRFPKIGKPAPRAFHWLKKFQEADALLILLTMRSDGRPDGSTPLKDAVTFCAANGIQFWQVNDNYEQASWTGSRKVYAHAYIDDAAVGCPLIGEFDCKVVDWDTVGPLVMKMIERRHGGD